MRHSNIFVTVDTLIFRKLLTEVELLLIKRRNDPFKNKWALPGGFVDEHEDLETAARREHLEETGIEATELHQVGAFGKPHRDPRSHTISIAYYGWARDSDVAQAADDAQDAQWFSIDALPELAFDHHEIVSETIKKMNL